MKPDDIIQFQNLSSLITGVKKDDFQLSAIIHQKESDLCNAVINRVKTDLEMHPFILFMEKTNDKLVSALKSICECSGKPFVEITNDEEAVNQREIYRSVINGVFVLDKRYSRSYDFKLSKEAHVLILANNGKLTHVEAI